MEEKKLLIVMGSMGRGGAERVISLISDFFCAKGWKVYIALLLSNKVDYILNENVTVVDLSGKTSSRIRRIPGWFYGIRHLVKQIRPDRVLAFAARINIITLLSCLGLKQKVVISERNDPYMDGRGKFVDMLTGILYPKAQAIIFQTRRAERYFEKKRFPNTQIIPNPISVKCEAENMKTRKIVSVGRLTRQKNQKMLIDAFKAIKDMYEDAELHIYGEGELREELTRQIDELLLSESVFLPGNVLNVHEQIADAGVFVLSSDYEGLSNALLEAMMMGLPCVSTNCAGSDEYIKHKENGLLIEKASKEQLVKAVEYLFEDKQRASQIGENAKRDSIKYSKDIVLEKWYQVITQ